MDFCIHCMEPLEAGAAFCPKCGKAQSYDCPPHHLQPGTLLSGGHYLIGAALGEGGFGITYIACDTQLEMTVAVKEFYPMGYVSRSNTQAKTVTAITRGQEFFEKGKSKFLAEARLLARLNDEPGIVDVRGVFEENNTVYIVMEYLRGETLKAYLNRTGTLPFREAYALLRPVMVSLMAAHEQNVVHRDIAPDNIILTRRGAKLLDFGAAREVFSEDERSLSIMVKRGYSPYEQYIKTNQGPWTDVYALCAVLVRAVTGRPPEDALKRLQAPDTPLPFDTAVPQAVQTALCKGLSIDFHQRYRSIGELLRALDDAAAAPDRPPVMPKDEHTLPAVEPTRMGVVPAPIPQPQPVVKPQQIDHTKATEAVWRGSPASQTDATVKAPARRPVQRLANAAVGQTVFFGSYPQSKDTAYVVPEPVEWLVLAREGNRALLISKYVLDCQPYHKRWGKTTWETCTLRKWLNEDFVNQAFSFEEQRRIQSATVSADGNPKYKRPNPGNITIDRIFLLSILEAKRYFHSDEARKCAPTAYAKARGVWTSKYAKTEGKPVCWWWLRTPGDSAYSAAGVKTVGEVSVNGSSVDSRDGAVRPAMWVTLDG